MIRVLPAAEPRVESGPIQFGDDWPGTFIRGDNAAAFALALRQVLDAADGNGPVLDYIPRAVCRGLLSDLEASRLDPDDALR